MKRLSKKYKCKLCKKYYSDNEMSDEHYPAHCVGNDDIVSFNIVEMFDSFFDKELKTEINQRLANGEELDKIQDDIFDNRLSSPLYPKGRTARTLCQNCNRFLGKYDEAYKKFFLADGNPKKINGFKIQTKYQIIKSIYAKFLSVPEAIKEKFDFIDFVKDEDLNDYNGKWNLYFIKRDYTTDMLGLKDIRTGMLTFDEGVVYELSDDKFIFNLMNFKKHDCYKMTNIFDILNKNYDLIEGVNEFGGYHGQIFMSSMFSQLLKKKRNKNS